MDKDLIDYLSGFITEQRKENFHQVLNFRTRYITLVLEDIYQSHNASAVLRSSECFGIQDVHIIENRNEYNINPDVTLGSNKWLTICRYNQKENNTEEAITRLRQNGYRIVATTPHHANQVDLDAFDLYPGKCALIFGSELNGISDSVKSLADEFLIVPMFGFTESFNISVSAAIVLYQLTYRLHKSNINWQLKEDEKRELFLDWIKKTIKRPDLLEQEFYRSIK